MQSKFTLAAGTLALTLCAPLSAAIYIKIPDIKGESTRAAPGVEPDEIDVKMADDGAQAKDSGEAHLDYLTITMTPNAAGHEATHVVQQRASGTADAPVNGLHWSGDGVPLRARVSERLRHKDRAISAEAAPRDAASGMATGKRQHRPVTLKPIEKGSSFMVPASSGPGTLTVAGTFDGCAAGRSYPHILVGDDEVGGEVMLEGVTTASCAAEEVAFNYEKITY